MFDLLRGLSLKLVDIKCDPDNIIGQTSVGRDVHTHKSSTLCVHMHVGKHTETQSHISAHTHTHLQLLLAISNILY